MVGYEQLKSWKWKVFSRFLTEDSPISSLIGLNHVVQGAGEEPYPIYTSGTYRNSWHGFINTGMPNIVWWMLTNDWINIAFQDSILKCMNNSRQTLTLLALTRWSLWKHVTNVIYVMYIEFGTSSYVPGADLGILRGGVLGRNSSKGGGGVRVQVRRNFHILITKKKKKNLGGG